MALEQRSLGSDWVDVVAVGTGRHRQRGRPLQLGQILISMRSTRTMKTGANFSDLGLNRRGLKASGSLPTALFGLPAGHAHTPLQIGQGLVHRHTAALDTPARDRRLTAGDEVRLGLPLGAAVGCRGERRGGFHARRLALH